MTASLRATATIATPPPRRALTRAWKPASGPAERMAEWAASASRPRAWAWPARLMWPPKAGRSPDWRTRGIEPEVAHQLGRSAEPADVPDDREHARRGDEADARDGQQPAHPRVVDDHARDRPVRGPDLLAQESVEPERRVERQALVGRQLERGQPASPGDPERIGQGERRSRRDRIAVTRLRVAVRSRTRPARWATSRRRRRVASSGIQTSGR